MAPQHRSSAIPKVCSSADATIGPGNGPDSCSQSHFQLSNFVMSPQAQGFLSLSLSPSLSLSVCIYAYVYIHVWVNITTYTCKQHREREREGLLHREVSRNFQSSPCICKAAMSWAELSEQCAQPSFRRTAISQEVLLWKGCSGALSIGKAGLCARTCPSL